MDPLSITAGVLGILKVAEPVYKGISKLHELYHAPDELSVLINEINDLRAMLSQIASFANQLQEERLHGPVVSLKSYLDQANEQLRLLDRLVNTELTKIHNSGRPRFSRKAWLRLKNRVHTAQKDLQNIRVNIGTILGVVTS